MLLIFIGINYFNFYMIGVKIGYVWVLCLLFFFFIKVILEVILIVNGY